MVGHTGNLFATIKAIEILDKQVAHIIKVCKEQDTCCLITSDHGNAEKMWDSETGQPHTAHTMYPVPLWLVNYHDKKSKLKKGSLQDIAPTVLSIMKLQKPIEMTGSSLIKSET